MSAGMLFLVAQGVVGLPALPAGTEVRLVSPDLLTVYASARIQDGRLAFPTAPGPGTELRLLFFLPDATKAERAAALSGARAISGRISVDGRDVLLQVADSDQPVSLRALLEQRGITLSFQASKGE
ncbi:MAG: hypothetical protein P8Y02_02505 [Deinococcales bacterium]